MISEEQNFINDTDRLPVVMSHAYLGSISFMHRLHSLANLCSFAVLRVSQSSSGRRFESESCELTPIPL